jgi:hypothetical protein
LAPAVAREPDLDQQQIGRAEVSRPAVAIDHYLERRLPAPEPQSQRATAAPAAAKPAAPAAAPPAARSVEVSPTLNIQQSITRIHEACQAPPLAPGEYRALFEVMAQEINENNLLGAQTIQNVQRRALERGLDLRRDDVRFVMEVVSETDPWFEQGASANLFAGRFRNFVVARCRGQGLKLSAEELDLIEAWFTGHGQVTQGTTGQGAARTAAARPAAPSYAEPAPRSVQPTQQQPAQRTTASAAAAEPALRAPDVYPSDELPRIVRSSRFKG